MTSRAERLERYAALRDAGMLPADAAREVGVNWDTGRHYERWYRKLRHLPVPRGAWP